MNQHCKLTMLKGQTSCMVARLESLEGFPLQPGSTLNRTFVLKPLAQSCTRMRGLCVDASLSKVFFRKFVKKIVVAFVLFKVTDESNLASSSLSASGNTNDLLGVVVSYSVKVKFKQVKLNQQPYLLIVGESGFHRNGRRT